PQDIRKSSFFRFLFSSLKEKRKNDIHENHKRRVANYIFHRKCDTPFFFFILRTAGRYIRGHPHDGHRTPPPLYASTKTKKAPQERLAPAPGICYNKEKERKTKERTK
ncbi:MAG: hypothetical protein IJ480_00095, partial [Clostridia bacterium]|nr:hypothetical protein [Clostridia bacterium]